MIERLKSAKFAYEQLGLSKDEVAQRYAIPPALVAKQQWTRQATPVPTPKDIDEYKDQVKSLLVRASVNKQLDQYLEYKDVEDLILSKLAALLDNIEPDDANAIRKVHTAVASLTALRQSDPLRLILEDEEGGSSSGVKVYIQNNVS